MARAGGASASLGASEAAARDEEAAGSVVTHSPAVKRRSLAPTEAGVYNPVCVIVPHLPGGGAGGASRTSTQSFAPVPLSPGVVKAVVEVN